VEESFVKAPKDNHSFHDREIIYVDWQTSR
jgi:hypothetical protein